MTNKIQRLPDAELSVMQALWDADAPQTRPQLEQRLSAQSWATTTLLSLLSRLETKGCIRREKQGKGYLYAAAFSRQDYQQSESSGVLRRAFGGSPKQFIAALYAGKSISRADLDELEVYLHTLQEKED